ncbi:MAG: LysR family transcriptional regulator [Rhodospirillaceae bacterium]|nr:LysR family transcriptional regulator [Rhodospirillales bacterium]
MNFQQLRIVQEAVCRDFNLTEVARTLVTSQSGVSKHIKDLEDELGVELFVRRGKRVLGLTAPGKELLGMIERILVDTANIRRVADRFNNRDGGQLTVVATDTQALHTLKTAVSEFRKTYPRVKLTLIQASHKESAAMLLRGQADLGLISEPVSDFPGLVTFPYSHWQPAIIVAAGHPLEEVKPLTLDALAAHPIVTYPNGINGRAAIDQAFNRAGLVPDVLLSTLDQEVLKTYIEHGLGVGIVAGTAFDPARDTKLRLLECGHLFSGATARLAIRQGQHLRGYAYRFIKLCAPDTDEAKVRAVATTPQTDTLARFA